MSSASDLHLHEDLGGLGGRAVGEGRGPQWQVLRLRLPAQALQRPVAALLDARRYPGEGRQAAERPAPTGELERGDVVLHPVVIPGERRRPEEIDGPVRADEPAAG